MKMSEAMTEYNQTAELDPSGTIGNYARQALQAAGSQLAYSLPAFPSLYSQSPYQQYGNFNSNLSGPQRTLLQLGGDLSNQIASTWIGNPNQLS